ncbi:VanZ family protein [Geobacillus sp. BK01]|uniref:VanZ family protein n=1 Tax=Geobacillus sp. BK01 TaxID=3457328 RepID=UPI003FA5E57C
MKKRWMLWMVVLAWCGMIYYFTESPLFTGANTANWIRETVGQLPFVHVHHIDDGMFSWNALVRKFAHVSVFGLLAVVVWRALYPRRWAMTGAWVFTVIYACFDEWHQSFQPGRTPLLSDVVIDALGATLALWIVRMSVRKVRQSYGQSVR